MRPANWLLTGFDVEQRTVEMTLVAPGDPVVDPMITQAAHRLATAGADQRVVSVPAALDMVSGIPTVRGAIHHTGRCGSTLITNLLRADRDLWVVGESTALNTALLGRAAGLTTAQDLLGVIQLAACDPTGANRTAVLKLTSWSAVLASELPEVPTVLLWSSPQRLVSGLLESPPRWLFQLLIDRGLRVALLGTEEWPDNVAADIARLWCRIADTSEWPRIRDLVSFEEIVADPFDSTDRVRRAFDLDPRGRTDGRRIEAGRDAKNPERAPFAGPRCSSLSPDTQAVIDQIIGDRPQRLAGWRDVRSSS